MVPRPPQHLKRVNVIIYPGFKALEATGAISVFEYANSTLRTRGEPPAYEIHICAPVPGLIRSDTKVVLEADESLWTEEIPHMAVVIGARDIDRALADQPAIIEWCKEAKKTETSLLGVCSGAFFLAEAGVLKNRRATTHWSVSDKLRARYADTTVVEDAIFVQDGHVWTSAGVTAVLDLMLAVVERDHGRAVALSVARDLVVFLKRPGGQSQFSQHLSCQMTEHTKIRALQEWILDNLEKKLDVDGLASLIAMSARNLRRQFLGEVGCTPSAFVERARIEKARSLMEDASYSLKQIASQCGFNSPDHLRRVFHKSFGVTPKSYQERFGSKPGSA